MKVWDFYTENKKVLGSKDVARQLVGYLAGYFSQEEISDASVKQIKETIFPKKKYPFVYCTLHNGFTKVGRGHFATVHGLNLTHCLQKGIAREIPEEARN